MLKNFAYIKDNKIINIAAFEDPTEELLQIFKQDLELDYIIEVFDGTRTMGGTYDGIKLWPPQPGPSWTKNEETTSWDPPVPYPTTDPYNPIHYFWNEDTLSWEELQI